MHWSSSLRRTPVAFALVACSVAAFLAFKELGFYGEILQLFNFVPITLAGNGARLGEPGADWWRFITPTLLHFGWMHLVFNCLWIWEFGRRIEAALGSLNLVGLFLASAAFSNSVQYFVSGPSIFGGMSGGCTPLWDLFGRVTRCAPNGWSLCRRLSSVSCWFGWVLAWLVRWSCWVRVPLPTAHIWAA